MNEELLRQIVRQESEEWRYVTRLGHHRPTTQFAAGMAAGYRIVLRMAGEIPLEGEQRDGADRLITTTRIRWA